MTNCSGGITAWDSFPSTVSISWLKWDSSPSDYSPARNPFVQHLQKMTRRPWRVKGDNKDATKTATRPGQVVSEDQLESNSPGLIAKLKGKLMQQRYKYATIFVDQYSGYTFIFLQRRLRSEETVQAKHAFERSADQRGVKILHYHADHSFKTARLKARACHIAGLTPISRMAWRRDASGTYKNRPGPPCSMQ